MNGLSKVLISQPQRDSRRYGLIGFCVFCETNLATEAFELFLQEREHFTNSNVIFAEVNSPPLSPSDCDSSFSFPKISPPLPRRHLSLIVASSSLSPFPSPSPVISNLSTVISHFCNELWDRLVFVVALKVLSSVEGSSQTPTINTPLTPSETPPDDPQTML
ncbi:hypothetical protein GBA52_019868 [Prunus armeniaca]|nr:hypothetical protein GBA52_019868 [Prunus armeniaca]